jgi:hypothetical protein
VVAEVEPVVAEVVVPRELVVPEVLRLEEVLVLASAFQLRMQLSLMVRVALAGMVDRARRLEHLGVPTPEKAEMVESVEMPHLLVAALVDLELSLFVIALAHFQLTLLH